MTDIFQRQLTAVMTEYENAMIRSDDDDLSDVLSEVEARDLQTRCLAAIARITGRESVYYERASSDDGGANPWCALPQQIGSAKSLLSDLQSGYLRTLEEIIRADLFGDFLEMAEHLNISGYKDAAAVIAGSTLETHLRQICALHGVPVIAKGKPKKADTLNAELTKAAADTKLDQKSITAWLDLRNSAAHGHYSGYDDKQVSLMIDGIREFLKRCPA